MNIINKLTIRHLKENKRRTLVTIFGVIISVAMISAVATLGVSFLDLMIRQTIAQEGEWHVQYKDVTPEQLEVIEKDSLTEKLIISNNLGYAELKGSKNEGKPYLFIKEYNDLGLEQFPIELSQGHLPENNEEIVISEEIANNAGVEYNIGDQLTLDIGQRVMPGAPDQLSQNDSLQKIDSELQEVLEKESTKTYTIVGTIKRPTWEPNWAPGYTVISYIDQNMLAKTDSVDAVVVVNKIKGSLFKDVERVANQNKIEEYTFNKELLRYYGVTDDDSLRMTLFSLTGIIIAVIIVGSVSLIYNAFAISVSERSRHLGMLSSVGATKKQKRNSVFFEGAIIGTISIPIGILAGLGGIAVTFMAINAFMYGALGVTEKLQVVVTPFSLIVACAVSIVTIFISTYGPAKKASKVSAIDAIRQTHDVKLTEKAVKTSKLVRKLFGMEAEIGLKNLKRNKKRYQATVFSLVISIVLFLSVSFFTENLKKSLVLSQEKISYDIQVYNDGAVTDLEPLRDSEFVTKSTMVEPFFFNSWINEENLPKELKGIVKEDPSILKDGKYPYYTTVYGLDEESFKDYANQVGADIDKVLNAEPLSSIVIGKNLYQDGETGKIIETESIITEVGEEIDLYTLDYENGEEEYVNKLEVGAITNQLPMGISSVGSGGLTMIVTSDTFHQLVHGLKDYNVQSYLYLNTSDPMATQEALEKVTKGNMYIYNVQQRRQEQEQLVMLMSVFTYGFIALISLVSIANIFNTISTSISLRKREFAMLRSVGMTPKGFNKMINYESMFYGIKALTFGLPISIGVMIAIYWSIRGTFEYGFTFPWMSMVSVVIAIFIIVGSAMLYSISKIRKENIIDGLKQENI